MAVFTALAGSNGEGEVGEVDIAYFDACDFGDAEAGGVQEFEDEAVFGGAGGGNDGEDVVAIEDSGEFFVFARMIEFEYEILPIEYFAVQKFEGADDLRDAGGGDVSLLDEMEDILCQVVVGQILEWASEGAREVGDDVFVEFDRVRAVLSDPELS